MGPSLITSCLARIPLFPTHLPFPKAPCRMANHPCLTIIPNLIVMIEKDPQTFCFFFLFPSNPSNLVRIDSSPRPSSTISFPSFSPPPLSYPSISLQVRCRGESTNKDPIKISSRVGESEWLAFTEYFLACLTVLGVGGEGEALFLCHQVI
jgi:hypothetical protein